MNLKSLLILGLISAVFNGASAAPILKLTNDSNPFATKLATGQSKLSPFNGGTSSVCTTLDFEENFGTGVGRVCDLNSASTTYDCNQISQVNDGEYSISNESTGLNTGWHAGMEDHTVGDTDGRMLFVNAAFEPGEFYRNTISLNEDTEYAFSAWITTVYDTDTGICGGTGIPSNVIFRIEDPTGALIEETNTGDIDNGSDVNWQQYFIEFNTGTNTDIQLVLINNSVGGCGNDLAIDDITLSIVDGSPQITTPNNLQDCSDDGDGIGQFDLDSQIPTILSGLDSSLFVVSFHNTFDDSEANSNPITNSTAYVNSSNPETIYVRVEKAAEPDCFSLTEFNLEIGIAVELATQLPNEVVICSDGVFPQLDATPTNSDIDLTAVIYEWVNGNNDVVSTDATYTPTAADDYTVTITLAPCSEEVINVPVIVVTLPELDLGDSQTLCDTIDFEIIPIISGNTDGITYLWSTGETTENITVTQSGIYELEITVGPCTVSDSIELFISNPIEIDLGEGFRTCPGEPRTLAVDINDSNATYAWSLNGTILAQETNSSLTFSVDEDAMGTQSYTVIVTNGLGCIAEGTIDVLLYDISNCVISQGISPNNDGFNDSLDLTFLSDRVESINQLQIFNRLGTLVYNQTDYTNQWSGQDKNGNELPVGTYFYVIDLKNTDVVYGQQTTGWVYINKETN